MYILSSLWVFHFKDNYLLTPLIIIIIKPDVSLSSPGFKWDFLPSSTCHPCKEMLVLVSLRFSLSRYWRTGKLWFMMCSVWSLLHKFSLVHCLPTLKPARVGSEHMCSDPTRVHSSIVNIETKTRQIVGNQLHLRDRVQWAGICRMASWWVTLGIIISYHWRQTKYLTKLSTCNVTV